MKRRSPGHYPRRADAPVVRTLQRRVVLHPLTAKTSKTSKTGG
ncbi:MAG: hypothetical protein ACXV3F_14925 [Frankiaceae bacterium]